MNITKKLVILIQKMIRFFSWFFNIFFNSYLILCCLQSNSKEKTCSTKNQESKNYNEVVLLHHTLFYIYFFNIFLYFYRYIIYCIKCF